MVVSETRDVGMDRALEKARTLHTSVGVALHGYQLEPQESAALQQLRTTIAHLENKVREIKVAKDDGKKAGLLAELDPIRQQVVEQCHQHKHAVVACQELLQEVLDWCELKSPAPAKPATYRSSVDDVQRSTDALINYAGFNSATDVSSSWVQSQAQMPQHKSSPYQATAATLNLSNWESSKATLRPVKTILESLKSNGTGSTLTPSTAASAYHIESKQQQHPQLTNSVHDHIRADQVPATPAALAAGAGTPKIHQATAAARAHAAKLTAQSRTSEAGSEQQQQQDEERHQSWKGQLKEAQQLARQLRPARPFLHLDGRSDSSITSSGGSGQGTAYYPGEMVLSRYSDHRGDEEGQGVVNSGWESVQHLRRQHSSSSMTSTDFTRALKTGSLQDAAILSSNASRVHILHDAVAHKPHAEGKLVDVPRVPACLAVHKKRRWWVKLLQILVATGGVAAAVGAAAITAAGGLEEFKKNVAHFGSDSASKSGKDSKQKARKGHQQRPMHKHKVSYAPMGPAPDASIGCG